MSEPSTSITEEQIAFEAMIGQLRAVLAEALESRGRLQNRVKELEGKLSTLTDQIEERDMKLAAMSEPPVWRNGPPPEPGVWFARVKNRPNEIADLGEWNDWFIEEWDQYELSHLVSDPSYYQHASVPEWLKPPVEPKPKTDPCEDFIKANIADNAMVKIGDLWLMPCQLRHLWPHIEAAIKGGVK